jgi:hypothetical protein
MRKRQTAATMVKGFKLVTCRKAHWCEACHKPIQAGVQAFSETYLEPDLRNHGKSHYKSRYRHQDCAHTPVLRQANLFGAQDAVAQHERAVVTEPIKF